MHNSITASSYKSTDSEETETHIICYRQSHVSLGMTPSNRQKDLSVRRHSRVCNGGGLLVESNKGVLFDVGGIRNQVISASFVMVAQSLYKYPVVIERVVLRKVRF